MASLQGSVLAVVTEGQQLAGVVGQLVGREAEQLAQHRQAQGGGGGTAALGAQADQLAEIAAPRAVLHTAGGAEAEAAAQQPSWQPLGIGQAIGTEATGHRRCFAEMLAQHQLAVFARLQPAIREVGLLGLIDGIGPRRIGHEIAMDHCLVAGAGLVAEVAGLQPHRPLVLQMGPHRMEFLAAVAAEHQRKQKSLAVAARPVDLTLERGMARTRWFQGAIDVATGRDELV